MTNDQRSFLLIYKVYAFALLGLGIFGSVFPPAEAVQWINGFHSDVLDPVAVAITNLGNGLILLPFLVLLLFRRFYMLLALLINAGIQGIIVSLFKRVLLPFAKRPINFLDPASVHFVPGIEVHQMMTFPSGHTVTIFGLAVFISLCYRNNFLSVFLVIIALLVGISRVYLLQHFILDVAGGATIGTVVGVVTFLFFERMRKPQWMEQRLEIQLRSGNPKSISQ